MIISYVFSNFRSFKARAELSMRASSQTSLNYNLIRTDGMRILPSSVIYGANASGKSNILMSLAVLRDIVIAGSLNASMGNLNNLELYPFIHSNDKNPMTFDIDFLSDGQRFKYKLGIEVECLRKGERKVIFEELYYVEKSGREINLFKRAAGDVFINKNRKALKLLLVKLKFVELIEEKLKQNLDSSELFLSRGFKSVVSDEIADVVIDFFKLRLVVVTDFTLKSASLLFDLPNNSSGSEIISNDLIERFIRCADFGPQEIFWKTNVDNKEDTKVAELFSSYTFKNEKVLIPSEYMESRGTLKLIDFILPFLSQFLYGGVLVLDEFDSSIHPEIIKGLIALFNNSDINKVGSQLIFTTHNPIYLNNRIFRRDQIRFVEKNDETYQSYLYSLADLGSRQVRNDHNYLINYFKGNYGALPYIDFSLLLKEGSACENA